MPNCYEITCKLPDPSELEEWFNYLAKKVPVCLVKTRGKWRRRQADLYSIWIAGSYIEEASPSENTKPQPEGFVVKSHPPDYDWGLI